MPDFIMLFRSYGGIAMMCAGCLLLVLCFVMGWAGANALRLISLLLVVGGVAVYVVCEKHSGRY